MNFQRYNKFWVALGSALAMLGTFLADGSVTGEEAVGVVLAFLGALGVYSVPNVRVVPDRTTIKGT